MKIELSPPPAAFAIEKLPALEAYLREPLNASQRDLSDTFDAEAPAIATALEANDPGKLADAIIKTIKLVLAMRGDLLPPLSIQEGK